MGEVARPWTTKEPALRDQRRPGGGVTSPGVCRNLFGTFDREENAKFVREELALLAERECQKWNFDFKEEKPKKGRFEWTLAGSENDKVDGDELAPSRDRKYCLDAGTSAGEDGARSGDEKMRMRMEEERDDDQKMRMRMVEERGDEEKMRMEEETGNERKMRMIEERGDEEKMRMEETADQENKVGKSSPPSVGEHATQKQITDFLRKRKNTVTKKLTSGQQQPITSSESDVKVKRRAST